MPSLALSQRVLPGARCLINQYIPQVKYCTNTLASRRNKGHLSCSAEFGKQVDYWLEQAVDHGWLDWGASACDAELQHALETEEPAAQAARSIWSALVQRGFIGIACQETVPNPIVGVAPVLDLRGFNAKGELTIVEVKCGWAHSTAQAETQLLPPFEWINGNHHNLALLQLGIQLYCLQQNPLHPSPMKPKNAWLLTLSPKKDAGGVTYETLVFHLNEDMIAASRDMIEINGT